MSEPVTYVSFWTAPTGGRMIDPADLPVEALASAAAEMLPDGGTMTVVDGIVTVSARHE